jgi:spore coat protein U-like protein
MFNKFHSIALLSSISALAPLAAGAASDTAQFQVKIAITSSCDVHTTAPTDMDFGSSGALTAALTQQSTLTVNCNNALPYNIGLNAGANASTAGDIATRRMTNGSEFVSYQLYQSSGTSTPWGNTIGTNTKTGTGSGNAQSLTVYGRVPAQTTPAAGNYADTITVTVTY